MSQISKTSVYVWKCTYKTVSFIGQKYSNGIVKQTTAKFHTQITEALWTLEQAIEIVISPNYRNRKWGEQVIVSTSNI